MMQAAIPKGGPARPVHSSPSSAVALATRLATNIKVSLPHHTTSCFSIPLCSLDEATVITTADNKLHVTHVPYPLTALLQSWVLTH